MFNFEVMQLNCCNDQNLDCLIVMEPNWFYRVQFLKNGTVRVEECVSLG